jgi:arylsulfatase A-like enzyme
MAYGKEWEGGRQWLASGLRLEICGRVGLWWALAAVIAALSTLTGGALTGGLLTGGALACAQEKAARETAGVKVDGGANPSQASGRRPNILFAFADDWGRFASAYARLDGPGTVNDILKTPNFDRLAREGLLFRRAFVSAPSCTPCRSALVSGQHFWRTGRGAILRGAVWEERHAAFPLLLRDSGYHIGETYKVWSPGTPGDAPFGAGKHAFEKAGGRFNQFSQNVTKMLARGEPLEPAKQSLYAEVRANFDAFLAARPAGQPFLYWFGPTNVHRQWQRGSGKRLWGLEPDELRGKMPPFLADEPEIREDLADYFGEVQAFDAALGVLMERLAELGELDNTLVVASGDHGAPGFPHGKCNLYDFGSSVSLAMRGPGVRPGQVFDGLVSLVDLAPTFLKTAGLAVPPAMTGRDLTAVMANAAAETWDAVFIGRERHVENARADFAPYPQRAIRTGDFLYIVNFRPERWPLGDPYRLFDGEPPTDREVSEQTRTTLPDEDAGPAKAWLVARRADPRWKQLFDLAYGKRPREELYDLRRDPHQVRNVAGEAEYAEQRASLEKRLIDELRRTGDPRLVEDGRFFETPPMAGPVDDPPARPARPGKKSNDANAKRARDASAAAEAAAPRDASPTAKSGSRPGSQSAAVATGGATRRLNVVFILADDLGWAETGCYGQKKVPTPHIDRLASQGMRFTQHYSGAPVCAPSRCVLMTGKHLGHAEIRGNRQAKAAFPQFQEGQHPLTAEAVTLATLFQRAGYATGAFGKWGLGPVGSTGDPNRQGFDLFFGYNCQAEAHSYFPSHLWRNAERVTLNTPAVSGHPKPPTGDIRLADWQGQQYAPRQIIAEAERFLDEQAGRRAEQPFFLYLPFIEPHVAMHPLPESVDKFPREWDDKPYRGQCGYTPHPRPRAGYAAMIADLDSYVGRILAALEKHRLRDRTLIVFSSDNGTTHPHPGDSTFHVGGVDAKFFASTADLRGYKGSVYEGGLRVPLIASLPGVISAGSVSDAPSYFADWMPTLCEAVGLVAPANMDGESLWPILRGGAPPATRKPMVWVFPEYGGQVAVRVGNWKAVRQKLKTKAPGPWELYDLAVDRAERNDVAASHGDVIREIERIVRAETNDNKTFPVPIGLERGIPEVPR